MSSGVTWAEARFSHLTSPAAVESTRPCRALRVLNRPSLRSMEHPPPPSPTPQSKTRVFEANKSKTLSQCAAPFAPKKHSARWAGRHIRDATRPLSPARAQRPSHVEYVGSCIHVHVHSRGAAVGMGGMDQGPMSPLSSTQGASA